MKIGIIVDDNYIYFNGQEFVSNVDENIDLKEDMINMAMEYLEQEKLLSRSIYNKENGIKVKKITYDINKPAA